MKWRICSSLLTRSNTLRVRLEPTSTKSCQSLRNTFGTSNRRVLMLGTPSIILDAACIPAAVSARRLSSFSRIFELACRAMANANVRWLRSAVARSLSMLNCAVRSACKLDECLLAASEVALACIFAARLTPRKAIVPAANARRPATRVWKRKTKSSTASIPIAILWIVSIADCSSRVENLAAD